MLWTNPNVSLNHINISWAEYPNTLIINSTAVSDQLDTLSPASILIDELQDQTNLTFFITAHYDNGGSSNSANITVQTGANHDGDGSADSLDADDDNDGVPDNADNCHQGQTGWTSNESNDADKDGCRDSDEDENPRRRNQSVRPYRIANRPCCYGPILMSPSTISISPGLNIQIPLSSTAPQSPDQLDTLSPASILIDELQDQTNLTFFITAHYDNGGSSNSANITVQTGANHDGDGSADSLDADDDNDGVPDNADNCHQGQTGWTSNESNDADKDGCRDSDEDENLAGVTNLSAIPNSEQALLLWTNPNVSLNHINISWAEYPNTLIINSTAVSDQLDTLSPASILIDELQDQTNLTFFITAHYDNGGSSNSANITVQTGANHDGDGSADSLDADDDNDGVPDNADNCHQGQTGWTSNESNDADKDGCRDSDEDENLAGVTNLSAIPNSEQALLLWTNPNVSLNHINISWAEYPNTLIINSTAVSDQLDTLSPASILIDELQDQTNLTFFITAHYDNGGSSNSANITVQTGANHDGDGSADSLDADDDNDGVPDNADNCHQGQTGWTSNESNDADKDGCRDSDEDENLAGVTNLSAIPNSEQALLLWTNPNVSLNHINISWAEYPNTLIINSTAVSDQLDTLSPASILIDELQDQTNLTFFITAHYDNGGSSNSANITVQTGANHDGDGSADSLDADDDNDGVPDNADNCHQGQTGWTSNESNDADKDGCRDSDEDEDRDDDGLIEIEFIEDLVGLRDDLNGDGMDDGNAPSISSAGTSGCSLLIGCRGL